jgi:hypothetical protein
VIHNNGGKLLFSNLNESEVNHISSFDAKSYPDTLVLVKPDSLAVGTMDSIQVRHFIRQNSFLLNISNHHLLMPVEITRPNSAFARAA